MKYLTAGESHGPYLTGIIAGFPAGFTLSIDQINQMLAQRQQGYGRGNRQKFEQDEIQIIGGVRHLTTLGSPIALLIKNRDHKNWQAIMNPNTPPTPENTNRKVKFPRPGHADLVGGMKTGQRDLRNVLERSSARETTMRVAIGAICEQLLNALGIQVIGYVSQIHDHELKQSSDLDLIKNEIHKNDLRIIDQSEVAPIHQLIDETKKAGTSIGGKVQVVVTNVPAGLGSYTNSDLKLDAKLAQAAMSVNACKGVSFGDGEALSNHFGKDVMDPISWDETKGWTRTSNHLGGFEGGMTNGEPIILNAIIKPIPTQYHPLETVDIDTKDGHPANVERSDVSAIVPASLIMQSVVATTIAQEILTMFDDHSFDRLKSQFEAYRNEINNF